jgi:hypothetical protein
MHFEVQKIKEKIDFRELSTRSTIVNPKINNIDVFLSFQMKQQHM